MRDLKAIFRKQFDAHKASITPRRVALFALVAFALLGSDVGQFVIKVLWTVMTNPYVLNTIAIVAVVWIVVRSGRQLRGPVTRVSHKLYDAFWAANERRS